MTHHEVRKVRDLLETEKQTVQTLKEQVARLEDELRDRENDALQVADTPASQAA
ncbi:MAG: hypothetical protein ISR52_06615 [Rhodospirillales bacterium]|nr:hypothetical protein [Rhodospirillales bacterium]